MSRSIADAIPALLPPLQRRAQRLVREGGLAVAPDDLVHDAIAIALGNAERFDGGNLAAWLHTIMRNQALNLGRHVRRRRYMEMQPGGVGDQDGGGDSGHGGFADLAVEAPQPAAVECRQVLTLLSGLRSEEQAVICLHAIEGCSYEEIGERLGLALGTVRSRLSRAKAELLARSEGRSARRHFLTHADRAPKTKRTNDTCGIAQRGHTGKARQTEVAGLTHKASRTERTGGTAEVQRAGEDGTGANERTDENPPPPPGMAFVAAIHRTAEVEAQRSFPARPCKEALPEAVRLFEAEMPA